MRKDKVPSRSLAAASASSWVSSLDLVVMMLFLLVSEPGPFLEASMEAAAADAALAAETFFDLEDCVCGCAALVVLFEQWQVENPLKKQTEHWMAIAPSDFRSNVADCCKIIVIFSQYYEQMTASWRGSIVHTTRMLREQAASPLLYYQNSLLGLPLSLSLALSLPLPFYYSAT